MDLDLDSPCIQIEGAVHGYPVHRQIQDGYIHLWGDFEVVGHGLGAITPLAPVQLGKLGLFVVRRVVLYVLGRFLVAWKRDGFAAWLLTSR